MSIPYINSNSTINRQPYHGCTYYDAKIPDIFSTFIDKTCLAPLNTDFTNYYSTKNQKLGIKEGAKLYFKGVIGRAKELAKEIKDHPIRTISMVGVSVAVLALLPIIGVSTSTGSAVLAGIFAAKAGYNIAKDIININKCNKNNNTYYLKSYVEKLGSDSFDLMLLAPPIPKGIKQLWYKSKSGTTFKIDKELVTSLKESKSIGEKLLCVFASDTKMAFKENLVKKPLTIKLLEKIKPNIKNKDLIQEGYQMIKSLLITVQSTFSSGLILAKRAKEIGLDDEYYEQSKSKAVSKMSQDKTLRWTLPILQSTKA